MERIGILGSGQVAKVLAKGFLTQGYEVMMGTRDPKGLSEFATDNGIAVGNFTETAAFGEIIILAVKGTAAETVVRLALPVNLENKLVLDTTNPIAELPPVNGVLQYFTSMNESLMERLQLIAPKAHFVKCWSCVGNAYMINPGFGDSKPTMFICGNNVESKKRTSDLLQEFGWETEDVGMVESARAIEPLCILWCAPGFLRKQWSHAFKLLKK